MAKYQAIDMQKKYKTNDQIKRVAAHNLRKGRQPSNVDPSRSHLNNYLVGSKGMDAVKAIEEHLEGVKYRKDAVRACHMVFSGSPEWFEDASKEDLKTWESRTMDYINDTFGAENVIYAVAHYDEKTPHIHVCAVPLKNNKLNMKAFFDGQKGLADNFHSKYNEYVKELGLERGVQYSKKTRSEIDEYENNIEKTNELINASNEAIEKAFNKVLENPNMKSLETFVNGIYDKFVPSVFGLRDKVRDQKKLITEYKTYEEKVNKILEPLKDIVGGWAGELPTVEDMEKVAELLNGYKNQSIMNNGKTGILNKVSEIRNDAEKPVESESDKMNRELAGGLRELFHGNKTKKLVK